jgi:hypothetical protein
MARIVFHMGMPKTGSTSIQHWLRTNRDSLRQQGFTVVVAPKTASGEIAFVPYRSGPVVSSWIVASVVSAPAVHAEVVETFVDALIAAADRYGNVVITGESFATLFRAAGSTLSPMQRLSERHEPRIAYYARPQHTSLEALWRQAGYRTGARPSAYVERGASNFHYAATQKRVHAAAPGLRFAPSPFRPDLLESGDVVVDFARRFLGVEAEEVEWANPGLPLEAINVLNAAPNGMFWAESFGNVRIGKIKQLLADHPLPEDDRIALSRRVLRKYAHERYAAENAKLGWHDFVPKPEDAEELPGIEALDELWEPQASPAERALLFRALEIASR